MTVSTNPDFIQTAGQLMLAAAIELGALGMGDSLEASEEEQMLLRLNLMMAKWSKDMNLWREDTATITITASTGVSTLATEIQDIRGVRVIQSSTYKRPLAQWNRDEFLALPNRAQTGSPMAFYVSKRVAGDVLNVWPAPVANQDFELDYNRSFYFAESPDQSLDIPKEWLETALYGLAARSANMFGAAGLDPAKVQRIDNQAKTEYDRLLDSDRPDSYYFEYDSPVEAR